MKHFYSTAIFFMGCALSNLDCYDTIEKLMMPATGMTEDELERAVGGKPFDYEDDSCSYPRSPVIFNTEDTSATESSNTTTFNTLSNKSSLTTKKKPVKEEALHNEDQRSPRQDISTTKIKKSSIKRKDSSTNTLEEKQPDDKKNSAKEKQNKQAYQKAFNTIKAIFEEEHRSNITESWAENTKIEIIEEITKKIYIRSQDKHAYIYALNDILFTPYLEWNKTTTIDDQDHLRLFYASNNIANKILPSVEKYLKKERTRRNRSRSAQRKKQK